MAAHVAEHVETPVEEAAPAGRRWRFGPAALVFMLVCGLLAGLAIGVLALRPGTPGDTSPEAGFARDMSVHHGQAVEMGMIAYERAQTELVRQLGYDIALGQQAEIGMMRQWLRDWDLLATGSDPPMAWMSPGSEPPAGNEPMAGMATADEMVALRQAEGAAVDRLFLQLMIAHHEGGVGMVNGVLARSDHPEVTWLAGIMQENHHRELEVLRNLQDEIA